MKAVQAREKPTPKKLITNRRTFHCAQEPWVRVL